MCPEAFHPSPAAEPPSDDNEAMRLSLIVQPTNWAVLFIATERIGQLQSSHSLFPALENVTVGSL
jgi:hypothetical protein